MVNEIPGAPVVRFQIENATDATVPSFFYLFAVLYTSLLYSTVRTVRTVRVVLYV